MFSLLRVLSACYESDLSYSFGAVCVCVCVFSPCAFFGFSLFFVGAFSLCVLSVLSVCVLCLLCVAADSTPTCVILGVILGVCLVYFWGPFGPPLKQNARFRKSHPQNT